MPNAKRKPRSAKRGSQGIAPLETAPDTLPIYCATDHEIYSSLRSAPQHFNVNHLREMGLQRGIIYSKDDDREFLIDQLSTQNFSYDQMRAIQGHFEYRGRGEKTTVIRINHAFSVKEIQQATEAYRETLRFGEKVFTHADGKSAYDVELQYVETDFSMTSLRQRQKREAVIHFEIEDNTTVVTFPSNARALDAVDRLRSTLTSSQEVIPEIEQIELSGLPNAGSRTKFFVDLISGLEHFDLSSVVRVRVEQANKDDKTLLAEEIDEEDDHPEEEEEMLSLVRAVALNGENLLQSRVYQDLRRRGYFITKIRWKAKLTASPFSLVEFDAGFDDLELGGRFRFSVLGWFPPTRDGGFKKVIAHLPDERRRDFLATVDRRAIELYRSARTGNVVGPGTEGGAGK